MAFWHFGLDSLIKYAGKEFEVTWEDGESGLMRIYTKDLKDGKGIRIRTERQTENKCFTLIIITKGGMFFAGPYVLLYYYILVLHDTLEHIFLRQY